VKNIAALAIYISFAQLGSVIGKFTKAVYNFYKSLLTSFCLPYYLWSGTTKFDCHLGLLL